MSETHEQYFQSDITSLVDGIKEVEMEIIAQVQEEDSIQDFYKTLLDEINNIPAYQLLSDENKEIYLHRLFGVFTAKDLLRLREARESEHIPTRVEITDELSYESDRHMSINRRLRREIGPRTFERAKRYKDGIIDIKGIQIETEEDDFFFF